MSPYLVNLRFVSHISFVDLYTASKMFQCKSIVNTLKTTKWIVWETSLKFIKNRDVYSISIDLIDNVLNVTLKKDLEIFKGQNAVIYSTMLTYTYEEKHKA